ncbi:hypothetical protein DSL72_009043 [Monilinia vaccinii-corymbosi]|uniref:Transcriptional activator HAP2 n=1 Tax=Monilinia vaccinii-corymbosi TaxID=61207 RepID=A0A8A3PN94_9HELO|nr:hypothetical protein DSL72_009043 [Monilinia vaccinii-corymbosi]
MTSKNSATPQPPTFNTLNVYHSCPICGHNKSATTDKIAIYERTIVQLETERKLLVRRNVELMMLRQGGGGGGSSMGFDGMKEEGLGGPEQGMMMMMMMPFNRWSVGVEGGSKSGSGDGYFVHGEEDRMGGVVEREEDDRVKRDELPHHVNAKQHYRILRRRGERQRFEETLRLRGKKGGSKVK